jgi:hypothetical protein
MVNKDNIRKFIIEVAQEIEKASNFKIHLGGHNPYWVIAIELIDISVPVGIVIQATDLDTHFNLVDFSLMMSAENNRVMDILEITETTTVKQAVDMILFMVKSFLKTCDHLTDK